MKVKSMHSIIVLLSLIAGGAASWGGAIWALHETGRVHFSGFLIALSGYALLVLAVIAADTLREKD